MVKENGKKICKIKKVALIEIGGSHDECLYSLIKSLKSLDHVHVTLICEEKLKKSVSYFDLIDEKYFVEIRKGFFEYLDLYKLKKYLCVNFFDTVIFNTAQGTRIKKLLSFSYPKGISFFGFLHNVKKLKGSHSQKKISKKIEKYFLLNDYLLEVIDPKIKGKINIGTFYPIFYPDYPELKLKKKEEEVWITIPGQVELKRRDYESLFDSIKISGISDNIKIILLGRCEHPTGCGDYIKRKIKELNLENHFLFWDNFVDTDVFYNYIKQSDFILPLIHPDHISFSLYTHQITGAFNLAFGYKKTLLLESSYRKYDDFKNNTVFYEKKDILDVINKLDKTLQYSNYDEDKWTFDYQRKKVLTELKN